jgi:hypothetical protein
MVVLDIEIIHGYFILVNHSLTSLVMLAPEFHKSLILQKRLSRRCNHRKERCQGNKV